MSVYNWEEGLSNLGLLPCQVMPKIEFSYGEDHYWMNNSYFGIGISYPERVKIIVQSQAVDFHSLIGNVGGYIGLFLGMTTYQILKLSSISSLL